MNPLFVRYRVVAIVSLLVLFFTQCYMTYHTYAWKDHDYYALLKPLVGNKYLSDLKGDLLYPGGERILGDYMARNYATLENLYSRDSSAFKLYAEKTVDSLLRELQAKSNLDNFMKKILLEHNMEPSTIYRVAIQDIGIKFADTGKDAVLYSNNIPVTEIGKDLLFRYGAVIDGSLEDCTQANRFTTILVDNREKCNCYIRFSLWMDSPDRTKSILTSLLPVLLLSLSSIAIMVFLFFATFRNWARQKKLADLKQDFVNNITHELNTPLTTIIVANRNLQDEQVLQNKEQIRSLTGIIERNSQWLRSLFGRVLQSEAISKSSLNLREYNLTNLLEELIKDYTLTLSNNDEIKISFHKFGDEKPVSLDKFWFTSMVYNLLENGIKYNKSEQKKLEVEIRYGEREVGLAIRDNGNGIPEPVQQRIFEKFYRKKDSGAGGLGLGLYYVKQCAEAHGWEIWLKSKVSVGSCFMISMPNTLDN